MDGLMMNRDESSAVGSYNGVAIDPTIEGRMPLVDDISVPTQTATTTERPANSSQ